MFSNIHGRVMKVEYNFGFKMFGKKKENIFFTKLKKDTTGY